jgi:hypothetical protein
MNRIKQNINVMNAFRFSNYSLPLINELPTQIHLGWSKDNNMLFFTGWKTILYECPRSFM